MQGDETPIKRQETGIRMLLGLRFLLIAEVARIVLGVGPRSEWFLFTPMAGGDIGSVQEAMRELLAGERTQPRKEVVSLECLENVSKLHHANMGTRYSACRQWQTGAGYQ
jgi:hypothetical protein